MGQQQAVPFRFPDGSVKLYPPDMDEVSRAQDILAEMPKRGGDPNMIRGLVDVGPQKAAQPDALNKLGLSVPPNMPFGTGNKIIEGVGHGLSFLSGLIPGVGAGGTAARVGGSMLGGLISGGPKGAGIEGLIQGAGEGLARGGPAAGLAAGSIVGGEGLGKQSREAIGSFLRERDRAAGPLRGLHNVPSAVPAVGTRIPTRQTQAGKSIEAFEETRPERVPVQSFKGTATSDAAAVRHKAEDPESFVKGFMKRGNDLVFQQAADASGVSQITLMNLLGSPAGSAPRQLGEMIMQTANRSVREAGELHRDIASKAREILNEYRKAPGERVGFSPETKERALQSLKISEDVKTAKEAVLPPEALKELGSLEKRFSDLAKMKSFSSKMWGGGGFLTPGGIGAAGVKGGVAYGLSQALPSLGIQGVDPATAAMLAASMTPANLARIGYLAGDVGELGPTIYRGVDATKTKRKKPGGK